MRKNSVKNTRINGEVQRVLAEVIRSEIKDPSFRRKYTLKGYVISAYRF